MDTWTRADALKPGDVIFDGQSHAWLQIIEARQEGELVLITSEIRGWGPTSRSEWSTDYRERFVLVE